MVTIGAGSRAAGAAAEQASGCTLIAAQAAVVEKAAAVEFAVVPKALPLTHQSSRLPENRTAASPRSAYHRKAKADEALPAIAPKGQPPECGAAAAKRTTPQADDRADADLPIAVRAVKSQKVLLTRAPIATIKAHGGEQPRKHHCAVKNRLARP